MTTPAPTSRTREAPQGDEEASSELKLGEFQDVDALTHSEAALVINALVQKRRLDRKGGNDTEYVFSLFTCIWVGWDGGHCVRGGAEMVGKRVRHMIWGCRRAHEKGVYRVDREAEADRA